MPVYDQCMVHPHAARLVDKMNINCPDALPCFNQLSLPSRFDCSSLSQVHFLRGPYLSLTGVASGYLLITLYTAVYLVNSPAEHPST